MISRLINPPGCILEIAPVVFTVADNGSLLSPGRKIKSVTVAVPMTPACAV